MMDDSGIHGGSLVSERVSEAAWKAAANHRRHGRMAFEVRL